MKHLPDSLLQQLIQARKAKGWSQAELGKQLGLPQGHISRLEAGQIDPRSGSLNEWAKALDLELALVPRPLLPALRQLLRGDAEEVSLASSILEEAQDL